jgi:predicted porin
MRVNSTKNSLASRNSFLGLKSDSVGTVLMGKHDAPYKIATRGLDVFGDQFADNRHLMGGVGKNTGSTMDARLGNVVAYISPKMSGFTGAIAYAVNTSVATGAVGEDKGSIWSLAGMYDQGPFFGSIAYQKVGFTTVASGQFVGAAGDSVKAWKIGAGYTMDAFKLNAVYEKITSSIGGLDTAGRNNYNLGGVYSFGTDDVKLSYTVAGNTAGTTATGAKMIGLGYDHNFSKTTSVYAQYNRIANDAGAAFGFNTAATTAAQAGVLGQKTSGFMLGMKHAFY